MINISINAILYSVGIFFFNFTQMIGGSFAKSPQTVVSSSTSYRILILGDSITEGLGVTSKEAFPYQLELLLNQKKLKQGKSEIVPHYFVTNGGFSGATTASGTRRMDWYLKEKTQMIVIALGANDGLRGIDANESKQNLSQAIDLARSKGLQVVLAGMYLPPNYGKDYRKEFAAVFQSLSKGKKIPLIPFLLEGVGGEKKLNQKDGIHPNAEGHKILADHLYQALAPILSSQPVSGDKVK
jgi:acyl-CoA thioesterase-1